MIIPAFDCAGHGLRGCSRGLVLVVVRLMLCGASRIIPGCVGGVTIRRCEGGVLLSGHFHPSSSRVSVPFSAAAEVKGKRVKPQESLGERETLKNNRDIILLLCLRTARTGGDWRGVTDFIE